METVLFGSFLTQYDAIKATFKEMKPFMNINEETGCFCYRLIFTLKIIFVVYAFDRAFYKHLSLIFKYAGNLFRACKNPVFREIFPNLLSTFIIMLLYKKPMILISAEFLIDICLLIFSSKYAVEAYKKELQKINYIIFICLFVQWSINHAAKIEHFSLSTYVLVLLLLWLLYLPMMPNNPKYGPRLTYLYILMSIWISYKLGQHYYRHDYVMEQNKIKGVLGDDLHTKLEPERGKLNETLQHLYKSNESICSDTENIPSSCYTRQNVVESKAVFPSNPRQNIIENLEQVSKTKSYSEGIQDEDTRNTMKSDISNVKELKKGGINYVPRTRTLKVQYTEQYHPSVSSKSSGIENEQKIDTVFKLPKTVYIDGEYILDESNNSQSKFKDDEIYENTLVTENKETTAQSEETHFEELPKSRLESTKDASEEENDVTGVSSKAVRGNEVIESDKVADSNFGITEAGKIAERRHETSESNDAIKPGGIKILNGKRNITIFKRHGEISEAKTSEKKENKLGGKVRDGEIYKNISVSENKEMTAQSEETHFEELPKSRLESTKEASEEENNVTGASSKAVRGNEVTDAGEVADNNVGITEASKISERRHETSESNDANFKPRGKNILNRKRKDLIFKSHGEISEAETSEKKENEFGSKDRGDEIYENILVPENKEMTAQSEEPHFEEVSKSRSESTDEENDVTRASSKAVRGNEVTETGEVADSNVGITEAGRIAKRMHETSESNDANFKPGRIKILNEKRKITIFKRHGKISEAKTSEKKENELGSKIRDGEINKNILVPENKEMTAQSEETHFEELPKSRLKSTKEASEEENDVIGTSSKAVSRGNEVTEAGEVANNNVGITEAGKIAERRHETSGSNDANFKPGGIKIFNGKRKIPIFKRHGEISEASTSKKKENELGSKIGSNDKAIQMITHPKNKSPIIIASGMQGTAGRSLTNIVHKVKRSPFRIGRKDGTELQIKNGASKDKSLSAAQGAIKPEKVQIVKLGKKLSPKKVVQNNVINL